MGPTGVSKFTFVLASRNLRHVSVFSAESLPLRLEIYIRSRHASNDTPLALSHRSRKIMARLGKLLIPRMQLRCAVEIGDVSLRVAETSGIRVMDDIIDDPVACAATGAVSV